MAKETERRDCDDDDGIARDAGHERRRETHTGAAQTVGAPSGYEPGANPALQFGDVAEKQDALTHTNAESIEEHIIGVFASGWAGPLPPPEELEQYSPVERERIVAWSDAQIMGESKRLDKAVDGEIRATTRGQWLNFLSATVPTVAAFAAFVATHDPLSFTFLAVPGVTIAVNVIGSVRHSAEKERRE